MKETVNSNSQYNCGALINSERVLDNTLPIIVDCIEHDFNEPGVFLTFFKRNTVKSKFLSNLSASRFSNELHCIEKISWEIADSLRGKIDASFYSSLLSIYPVRYYDPSTGSGTLLLKNISTAKSRSTLSFGNVNKWHSKSLYYFTSTALERKLTFPSIATTVSELSKNNTYALLTFNWYKKQLKECTKESEQPPSPTVADIISDRFKKSFESILKYLIIKIQKTVKRLRRNIHRLTYIDFRFLIRTIVRTMRLTPFDGKSDDNAFFHLFNMKKTSVINFINSFKCLLKPNYCNISSESSRNWKHATR